MAQWAGGERMQVLFPLWLILNIFLITEDLQVETFNGELFAVALKNDKSRREVRIGEKPGILFYCE